MPIDTKFVINSAQTEMTLAKDLIGQIEQSLDGLEATFQSEGELNEQQIMPLMNQMTGAAQNAVNALTNWLLFSKRLAVTAERR
jgi:hypothetical protein